MGNLLQTRPAETTTAAAGTIGAIIAAAASHDYTTAVVLAVVSYLPAIITLLHLTANRPASSVIRVLEDLGVAGLTRKPGENDAAYAERLSAAVHTLPGQLHVLVDGKPVAANITVAAPAPADTAHPGPLPTEAAAASTEQPPPIQGS